MARKLETKQHEPHKKLGLISGTPEESSPQNSILKSNMSHEITHARRKCFLPLWSKSKLEDGVFVVAD